MDHDHGDMEITQEIVQKVCKMNMSFHWGACEFILWKSWQANTPAKFVAACIGFFLMAVLYEALKYYREALLIKSQQARQTVVKNSNGEVTTKTVKLSAMEEMFNVPHLVQTALQFLQVFTSYILMLIIMLCNLWLVLAICLGAAVGYFTFGWMRKVSCNDPGECCY